MRLVQETRAKVSRIEQGTRTRVETAGLTDRERKREREREIEGRKIERERDSTTSTVATRKFDFQIGVARTNGQRGRVGGQGRGGERTRGTLARVVVCAKSAFVCRRKRMCARKGGGDSAR